MCIGVINLLPPFKGPRSAKSDSSRDSLIYLDPCRRELRSVNEIRGGLDDEFGISTSLTKTNRRLLLPGSSKRSTWHEK